MFGFSAGRRIRVVTGDCPADFLELSANPPGSAACLVAGRDGRPDARQAPWIHAATMVAAGVVSRSARPIRLMAGWRGSCRTRRAGDERTDRCDLDRCHHRDFCREHRLAQNDIKAFLLIPPFRTPVTLMGVGVGWRGGRACSI